MKKTTGGFRPVRMVAMAALALTLVFAAHTAQAQTFDSGKAVTLSDRTLTRAQAIAAVKAQTGLEVTFNRSNFDDKAVVDFGKTNISLGNLLDELVKNTGNKYTVSRSYIIIHRDGRPQEGLVVVAAERAVTGVVTDTRNGKALDGVRVELLDHPAARAQTSANGRFRMEGVAPGNHVVKLTSEDGTVRYREVFVPTGADPEVKLSLDGAIVKEADTTTAPAQTSANVAADTKINSYYLPSAVYNTVRAHSDEAKVEYTNIPTSHLRKGYLAKSAVKTNLLYLGTTSPNLAVEFALARKWTMDVSAVFNVFELQEDGINRFAFVQPEVRYWFCNRFEKHFVGLHAIAGTFNVGDVTFLTKTFETHRYDGWGAGGGLSYGYHLPMGKRWAWEFTAGVGYVYLEYDKYRCYDCDEFVSKKNRHYFGPTKAGISLMFMIR